MELKATSLGKLLLFGEHAVLYKYPAIGFALDRGVEICLKPGTRDLRLAIPVHYRNSVLVVLQRICSVLGTDLPQGTLSIESQLPSGSGFGSSAAICVALARLCVAAAKEGAPGYSGPAHDDPAHDDPAHDDPAIWRAAHEGEKHFHGTPSGIDTALSCYGGLIRFDPRDDFPPELTRCPKPAKLHILYGTVPRLSACAGNVAAIARSMQAGDFAIQSSIAALGRLSMEACMFFEDRQPQDPVYLGRLATSAMATIRDMKLSSPALDTLLETGMAAGALGGKMSGAGGGGAFWMICEDEIRAFRVKSALVSAALRLNLPGNAYLEYIRL